MKKNLRDNIEGKAGVIIAIDEPALVEEMNKLIPQHAEKLKLHRFKCDYENCNRILKTNKTEFFKCTACGHGTMEMQKPRNYCCECGEPMYFNVSKDFDVVCDKCTAAKVAEVEELEKQVGNDLLKLRRKSRKGKKVEKKDEPLGIIRNKKNYNYAHSLWEQRQEKKDSKKGE